jgi:hypothetical protein
VHPRVCSLNRHVPEQCSPTTHIALPPQTWHHTTKNNIQHPNCYLACFSGLCHDPRLQTPNRAAKQSTPSPQNTSTVQACLSEKRTERYKSAIDATSTPRLSRHQKVFHTVYLARPCC